MSIAKIHVCAAALVLSCMAVAHSNTVVTDLYIEKAEIAHNHGPLADSQNGVKFNQLGLTPESKPVTFYVPTPEISWEMHQERQQHYW